MSKGLQFAAGAVATTALVQNALAFDVEGFPNVGKAVTPEAVDEKPKKGMGEVKRAVEESKPWVAPDYAKQDSYKFFAEIGRGVVEGRYTGKLKSVNIAWSKGDVHTIPLKPEQHGQPFAFNKHALRDASRCNNGEKQPWNKFDQHYLATLGQLVYYAEQCTPDDETIQTLNVTSIYRSEKYNASVGGKKHSRHLDGFAIDLWKVGKAERQHVYGAGTTGEAAMNPAAVVYYERVWNEEEERWEGGFVHTDASSYAGDWENVGVEKCKSMQRAFVAWQKQNGITPFSMERCFDTERQIEVAALENRAFATDLEPAHPFTDRENFPVRNPKAAARVSAAGKTESPSRWDYWSRRLGFNSTPPDGRTAALKPVMGLDETTGREFLVEYVEEITR